jgi:hypothetical protein
MPTLHSTVCIACWSAVPVKGSTIPHSSRCTQRHSHHNHRRHSRQIRRRSRRSQTEIATFRALNSAHKLSTTNFRSAQILSARTSNLSQPQVQNARVVTTPTRKVLCVVLGHLDQFLSNIKGPTPQHVQHRFLVNAQRLSGRRDHLETGRRPPTSLKPKSPTPLNSIVAGAIY